MSITGAVIQVDGLVKRYGELVAVDRVSFQVEQGEIFGLLGPNGAGKTTTVECLEGLRKPEEGVVRVLGLDPVAHGRELRRRIGCQLQESALPARIRVAEALELFSSVGTGGGDPATLLSQWGLADKRRAPFASLSGGQRQRLFVALALVNEPEVVFLDEMTTGLDPSARRVAWDLIRAIRDDRGATVVLVTHFMEEAERLCDRVGVLIDGRIAALETPERIVNRIVPEFRITVPLDTGSAEDWAWVASLQGVHDVRRHGSRLEVEGVDPALAALAAGLLERGYSTAGLRVHQPTLEDAFLRLTSGGA